MAVFAARVAHASYWGRPINGRPRQLDRQDGLGHDVHDTQSRAREKSLETP